MSPQRSPEPPSPATVIRNDIDLAAIPAEAWDALTQGHPLLCHAFLCALHATGCAAPDTGWRPCYLTAWCADTLTGALPLYAKTHSYGEYVFDWAWADAFRRHGRRYYPKLVAAVPFTPAPGPRLIARDEATRGALLERALAMLHAQDRGADSRYSSLHVLFATPEETALCARAGMIVRHGVQFEWQNPGHRDFADYLAAFNHDKRKKVKQERRRLADSGVTFRRLTGSDITDADWAFFYDCYESTYHAHHSTPYLSLDFFTRIAASMPDNLLLVVGAHGGRPLCAALDIFDQATLWGRYWGTHAYVPGLHFEACYYQAIEFCIERKIARFAGGAQGVHKLARGLMPVTTCSAHAIADPDFAAAIADFCARERADVAHAVDELEGASPFRES
ncbi:MAG: GNAT family N-acetyltransferase [Casimicrobiaceae bacterium]